MRLHRKLTSPRLGAMFSPPLSSFESGDWSQPTSPVKECAGWAVHGLGRPNRPRRSSRQRHEDQLAGFFSTFLNEPACDGF